MKNYGTDYQRQESKTEEDRVKGYNQEKSPNEEQRKNVEECKVGKTARDCS